MQSSPGSFARSWDAVMRFLRDYHSYEVVGAEHVPRTGPVLVASTHSLATYENFMLGSYSLETLGRRPYIVADNLLFRAPAMARALREIGVIPGDRVAAVDLLRAGEIVGLGPGGMREALRSSKEKYRFDWSGRFGFVWVSLMSGAPIVLAACPGADDVYTVYDSPVTSWAYRRLHFPLPFFRGLGLTIVPRPVKLWHVLSEPIFPDVPPGDVREEHVIPHHRRVIERMHDLMERAKRITTEGR